MLIVVKAMGASYPAVQLVFLRSLVGLVLVAPLLWRQRAALLRTRRVGRHLLRVGCNAAALTCSFTAVAALPLALLTTIGFTRPLAFLLLAALLLGERVGRARWAVTGLGFVGVLVAVRPDTAPLEPGLLAALGAVVFGTLAVIETRRLKGEPAVVMMGFYTVALTLLTALPAALAWRPVEPADWPALLAIGALAQAAQWCFLRAHHTAEARVLAPLGYLSLPATALAGWLAFGETPTASMLAGAAVIVAASLALRALPDARARQSPWRPRR
jgi:S-adenosylmethionine uptake transporter